MTRLARILKPVLPGALFGALFPEHDELRRSMILLWLLPGPRSSFSMFTEDAGGYWVYPTVRQLERDGLARSFKGFDSPERHFYELTASGRAAAIEEIAK